MTFYRHRLSSCFFQLNLTIHHYFFLNIVMSWSLLKKPLNSVHKIQGGDSYYCDSKSFNFPRRGKNATSSNWRTFQQRLDSVISYSRSKLGRQFICMFHKLGAQGDELQVDNSIFFTGNRKAISNPFLSTHKLYARKN